MVHEDNAQTLLYTADEDQDPQALRRPPPDQPPERRHRDPGPNARAGATGPTAS